MMRHTCNSKLNRPDNEDPDGGGGSVGDTGVEPGVGYVD